MSIERCAIIIDKNLPIGLIANTAAILTLSLGKLKPEDLHHIISSKNRSEAGYSVPAHGLYLTKIAYPYNLN